MSEYHWSAFQFLESQRHTYGSLQKAYVTHFILSAQQSPFSIEHTANELRVDRRLVSRIAKELIKEKKVYVSRRKHYLATELTIK